MRQNIIRIYPAFEPGDTASMCVLAKDGKNSERYDLFIEDGKLLIEPCLEERRK